MRRCLWFFALGGAVLHINSSVSLGVRLEFEDANSTSSGSLVASASASPASYEWHSLWKTTFITDPPIVGAGTYGLGVAYFAASSPWEFSGGDNWPYPQWAVLPSASALFPGDVTSLRKQYARLGAFGWQVALGGGSLGFPFQPASFSSSVTGTFTLCWKLTPGSEREKVGTPLALCFSLPYDTIDWASEVLPLVPPVAGPDNIDCEITYNLRLAIGQQTFGPYEVRCAGCPPALVGENPDPLAITDVSARVGDTIKLSLEIKAKAGTVDPQRPSWYGEGPLVRMGLAVAVNYWDYGDAPGPYPTTLAQDGARHILEGPWLGFHQPDGEPDGQPSDDATGDDKNGDPDEDGVKFVGDVVPGQKARLEIILNGQGEDLTYAVWVDWNNNGQWEDPSERFAFGNMAGVSDPTRVEVTGSVPTWANPPKTFMRARVYKGLNAIVSPVGDGGDGEVEDYLVKVKADGIIVMPPILLGIKFNDVNGNGVYDPGEPGLADWTIWLDLNGNGRKDPGEDTRTDSQGVFFFSSVPAGTYTVHEEVQAGWRQTWPGGAGTQHVTVVAGNTTPLVLFGNTKNCSSARWHTIDFPTCDCPSGCPAGRLGEAIDADSGERLEVQWVKQPFPHYELRYCPPGDQTGFAISAGVFGEGANYAEYLAADADGNGKPDRFCLVIWHDWDFGYDQGTPGFLDHLLERYDVCKNQFSATLFLHRYAAGCTALIGSPACWCDLKQLKKECRPPSDMIFQVAPVVTALPLGSPTQPSLMDLLAPLSAWFPVNPGASTVMGHLPVRLCDMDWDADCDLADLQIASGAVGTHWQDPGYCALADIDGDGYVSESDLSSLFDGADVDLRGQTDMADLLSLADRWLASVP
jgi:hypothetical protein